MLFRGKGPNLCFRFSNTHTWIFFSMKFDGGNFPARVQGQSLNPGGQRWPLNPLMFKQCIQLYVQAAQVKSLPLHHVGKTENTPYEKKQHKQKNAFLIHNFSLSAQ